MIGVGFELPKKGVLFSIGGVHAKADLLSAAKKFSEMGFEIFGTEGTADFFNEHGVSTKKLQKISTKKSPNILEAMTHREFDLVVNIPKNYSRSTITDGYLIRRKAMDLNIPLVTNVQVAKIVAEALKRYKISDLKILDIKNYF